MHSRTLRIILCFVFLFYYVESQPLAGWAFNISNYSPVFYPPSTNHMCKPFSQLFYYAFINYTFSFSGMREIITLSSISDVHLGIALYKGGFDPFYSCNNFSSFLTNLIPIYDLYNNFKDEFFFFERDIVYNFVVIMAVEDYQPVELSIPEPTMTGTMNANDVWQGTYVFEEGKYNCKMGNISNIYSKQTWLQNDSGFFDIYGAFEEDVPTELGVFSGNISTEETINNNPCDYYIGGFSPTRLNSYSIIPSLYLNSGQIYTAIFSGNASYYGIQVIPKRKQTIQPDWMAPNINLFPECIPDKTTTMNVAVTSFTASFRRSIVASNQLHFLSFVYSGDNTGTNTTLPQTCPATAEWIAYNGEEQQKNESIIFSSIVGQYYSVVLGQIVDSNFPDFVVVVLSGVPTPAQQVNYTSTTLTSTSYLSTISSSTSTTGSSSSLTPLNFSSICIFIFFLCIY